MRAPFPRGIAAARNFRALVGASVCLLFGCAANPGRIAGPRTAFPQAGAPPESRAPLIGWFESRYGVERIRELSREGNSIVVPYVGSKGDAESISLYLDAAADEGLGVALQIPGDFVQAGDMEAMAAWVDRFKDHPAVALWYLSDEPDINNVPPKNLAKAASLLRARGGGHPIAVTFYRPEDARKRYSGSFDLLWLNYYPVLVGTPEFLSIRIGGFAARVAAGRRAADACKAGFGMIVQAYGPSDSGENQFNRRLPTRDEFSYMVWVSLKENPTHLLFWSRYRTSEAWLEKVFHPVMEPVARIAAEGIEALGEKGFRLSRAQADIYRFRAADRNYLAIIADSRPIENADLAVPGGIEVHEAIVPPSATIRKLKPGRWRLNAPPFSVVVLELRE